MEGDLTVDPTTGTMIFDTGERPMPGGAGELPPTDSEGRGSVFGDLAEAAAPTPQAAALAPTPSLASAPPPAPAAQPADVQEIERAAAAGYRAAIVAQQEGQALYRDAAGRAQRVAARRDEAERSWAEGSVTPTDVTRFIAEQHRDTAAAVHGMEQAQGKLADARAYGTTGEAHSMWAAIRARIPNVDENSPALGKLASDLIDLRRASGYRTPYRELLDEHLTAMRDHLGATPAPTKPAAAPGARLSAEDARTFGLA